MNGAGLVAMTWDIGVLAPLLVPGNGTACLETRPCMSAGVPECSVQRELYEYAVNFVSDPGLAPLNYAARRPSETFVVDATIVAFDVDVV